MTKHVDVHIAESRDDVLVVPFARPCLGGVDPAVAPWHAHVLRGDEAKDRFDGAAGVRASVRCEGRFLYGGPLQDHFGHVMIDAIPRLWAYRRDCHDGVLFPVVGNLAPEVPAWMQGIFDYLGLGAGDLQLVRQPTVFEQVDFAPPGNILRRGPAPWYLDWLRTRARPMAGATGEKLYYGRAHMLDHGTVMGERYYAQALQANGFRYVRPETLPLQEQIRLAARAETIVFLEGSSIYITELLADLRADVFMFPRRPKGHELFGPQLRPRARSFTTLGASLVRLENRRGQVKPDSPSYVLNPAELYAGMREAGLVQGAFDEPAFRRAEEADALAYFDGAPDTARAQLDQVRGGSAR